jgi:hypothetical protein
MNNLVDKIQNFMRPKTSPGIVGIWLNDHGLVKAAKRTRDMGITKAEAISPFPLHGIDEALGIPRSSIPWVTFIFGMTGCLFGVWFTWYVAAHDWPVNIGGKPMWSFAAFIPIIFETTVLLAALSSVGAMILINGLPKVDPVVIDPALTSHKFALFVPESDSAYNADQLEKLFKEMGADEVRKAEF